MRFFRRSLIALGVAAILPALLFTAFLTISLLRAERHRVESETLARSSHLSMLIDARLRAEASVLRVLSMSPHLDTREWAAHYEHLMQVRAGHRHWKTVQLYDAQARRSLLDLRHPPHARLTHTANVPDFARMTSDVTLIDGIVEFGAGDYAIWIHLPVMRDGQLAFVYSIAIDPEMIQGLMLRNTITDSTTAVVDAQGRFIARNVNYTQRLGRPATEHLRNVIQTSMGGLYRGTTYEGLPNYTAFHRSAWTGWSVHIAIPSTLIDAPSAWTLLVAGGAGLGGLLLGAVLIVLVLRDMAERRRAEETLRQSQKMEAIGQLTGGIAHDFNNLLTAIIGNLDLIRSRSVDNPRIWRLSDHALEAARRGAKLTSQLLAFSRHQRLALTSVDLRKLLEGMSNLLQQSLGKSIHMQVYIDPNARTAVSDANQLELALLNLAVNARDAMPQGGTLTISTRPAPDADVRGLPPGGYIELRVSDTGAGMSEAVRARAMEPFFTTKAVGRGTGLGLSQVYGIVRESGGTMMLESIEGEGTTVRLILPAAADTSPITQTLEALPATIPGGYREARRRILVVDDDDQVRRFVVDSLQTLGYDVLEASGGLAALALLEQHGFDLLVMDFAMPEMNGAQLAAAARERWPALRMLLISGYADSAAVDSAVGSIDQLRKPFDLAELGQAVADALGKIDERQ